MSLVPAACAFLWSVPSSARCALFVRPKPDADVRMLVEQDRRQHDPRRVLADPPAGHALCRAVLQLLRPDDAEALCGAGSRAVSADADLAPVAFPFSFAQVLAIAQGPSAASGVFRWQLFLTG
jgi:hypothetical protein